MPQKYLDQNINTKFIIKEKQLIKGKEFAIIAFKNKEQQKKVYQYLTGYTFHKNGLIQFEFTSFKSDRKNENFIEDSYNALLTTEFK